MPAHIGPLTRGNTAIFELQAWLEDQREQGRARLEREKDVDEIRRIQGRLQLVSELLLVVDPNHRRIGESLERG